MVCDLKVRSPSSFVASTKRTTIFPSCDKIENVVCKGKGHCIKVKGLRQHWLGMKNTIGIEPETELEIEFK